MRRRIEEGKREKKKIPKPLITKRRKPRTPSKKTRKFPKVEEKSDSFKREGEKK